MAKKRRRKRVEDAKPDGAAAAAPEPKLQGNVASAKDTTGVKEQEQIPLPQEREGDESNSYGEDQEDKDTPTLGDILIPPLPSELGADAVRISQVGCLLFRGSVGRRVYCELAAVTHLSSKTSHAHL